MSTRRGQSERGELYNISARINVGDEGAFTVKVWVTGGSQEVRAWISTDGEVPSSVHAHEVIGERILATLHIVPERLHILAVEQLYDHLIVTPLTRSPFGNVTFQATRVVAESDLTGGGRVAVVEDRVVGGTCEIGKDWPQIHRPVFHGARGDAATTTAMRNVDQRRSVSRDAISRLVCAAEDTVTPKRRV
jgi:hypothetical protein